MRGLGGFIAVMLSIIESYAIDQVVRVTGTL